MRQEIQLVSDNPLSKAECARFISDCRYTNTTCINRDFAFDITKEEFIKSLVQVANSVGLSTFRSYSTDSRQLTFEFENHLMIQIFFGEGCEDWESQKNFYNFQLLLISTTEISNNIISGLVKLHGDGVIATAKWYYDSKDYIQNVTIPLSKPLSIVDSMYPMLKGGVDYYLDFYIQNSASVLFMMGVAGTGKSNLIRHLTYKYKFTAFITYDQELLSSDELFVNFMQYQGKAALVIEDADLLVTSRDGDNNSFISRFLNVSDGLIKSGTKKMIFTTNQGDFRHVDQALIRAGRCFGALKFRPLTYEEICVVADDVGRERPVERRDYTLADFFNPESNQTVDLSKIGF